MNSDVSLHSLIASMLTFWGSCFFVPLDVVADQECWLVSLAYTIITYRPVRECTFNKKTWHLSPASFHQSSLGEVQQW